MQCLQTYLVMYETINGNKMNTNNEEIDSFLVLADPFQMDDRNPIITRFIEAYQKQFQDTYVNSQQAYAFVLQFLQSFNCEPLTNCFMKSSSTHWLDRHEMIVH